MDWKQLQVEVAKLFNEVGCSTQENVKIPGARGEHNIDVYVKFDKFSFNCVWIIECKNWNSNITKEKVLALQSIVQDIGADKGIIVAKQGFQSGAIKCARKTNVILTNFDDLKDYITEEIKHHGWDVLSKRIWYIGQKLLKNRFDPGKLGYIGHVAILELKIREARYGSGRMVLVKNLDEEKFVRYTEAEAFIKHANELLDEIQNRRNIV